MKFSRSLLSFGFLAVAALAATAQSSTPTPATDSLLPQSFGSWQPAAAIAQEEPSFSLANANKAALSEDSPQRSQVADFQRANGHLHVEAVELADFTGAFSAFTLLRKGGTPDQKLVGVHSAVVDHALLFQQGSVVVVAFPVSTEAAASAQGEARISDLKALAALLPVARGAQAQPPLLPRLAPEKEQVAGSLRYALGAATYSAQGGVLPAANLGWEKSAEAVTASYKDKRGEETLTLLLYPTPQISEASLKQIQRLLPGLGEHFSTATLRREGTLLLVANGAWPRADADKFLAGIHLKQLASNDAGAPPPEFQSEVRKTASLLVNITILAGVLCTAAVLLGLFLGGGRAAIRVLRGKPAASEPEFLSLHLDNQNAPVQLPLKNSPTAPEKAAENTE